MVLLYLLLKLNTVLGRIRKIAKSDYSLGHICPSVRVEQLGSRCTDFHERYLRIFGKKNYRENSSFIKIG
jgi:hypothetical protein